MCLPTRLRTSTAIPGPQKGTSFFSRINSHSPCPSICTHRILLVYTPRKPCSYCVLLTFNFRVHFLFSGCRYAFLDLLALLLSFHPSSAVRARGDLSGGKFHPSRAPSSAPSHSPAHTYTYSHTRAHTHTRAGSLRCVRWNLVSGQRLCLAGGSGWRHGTGWPLGARGRVVYVARRTLRAR